MCNTGKFIICLQIGQINLKCSKAPDFKRRFFIFYVRTPININCSLFPFVEFPAVVAVIDHLVRHAAVDDDVLAGDETGFL